MRSTGRPLARKMRGDLFVKKQRVVDEHRANHDEDQRQINPPHPPVDLPAEVPACPPATEMSRGFFR